MTNAPRLKPRLIIAAIFAFAVFIFSLGQGLSLLMGLLIVHTRFVPGGSAHFDPLAHFDKIRKEAGSEQLEFISLTANGIASNGTMDLRASYKPAPTAEYLFSRTESAPPKDAPPRVDANGQPIPWRTPITVLLHKPFRTWSHTRIAGGFRGFRYNYLTLGMDRRISSPQTEFIGIPVEPPRCSTTGLWEEALRNGAPKNALARIEYSAKGYRFDIPDAHIRLTFNAQCELTTQK